MDSAGRALEEVPVGDIARREHGGGMVVEEDRDLVGAHGRREEAACAVDTFHGDIHSALDEREGRWDTGVDAS